MPELNRKIWDSLLKRPKDFNLVNSESASVNFKDWLGVTCFSENHNNTLMWSHYADSHKGLVLEFKKDISKFLTKNILPVNYYKDFPIINVSDYTEEQMIAIIYQFICAKGIDWEYENELRVITTPSNALHDFDKSELVGVIFGLQTEEKIK